MVKDLPFDSCALSLWLLVHPVKSSGQDAEWGSVSRCPNQSGTAPGCSASLRKELTPRDSHLERSRKVLHATARATVAEKMMLLHFIHWCELNKIFFPWEIGKKTTGLGEQQQDSQSTPLLLSVADEASRKKAVFPQPLQLIGCLW